MFKLFPIELLFELGRVDTQFELFLDSDEDSNEDKIVLFPLLLLDELKYWFKLADIK